MILEKDSFTTMFTTLIESAVNEQYPQLIFNRSEPTELNIIFNAFNDYAVIRLPDHKIRDVFYLLGQLAKHHFCPVVKESTETERKNFETIATMNTLEDLGDN